MDEQEQKKIDHLERIINNLNQHWHSIQLLLGHVSKPLLVDDRGLRNVFLEINKSMNIVLDNLRQTIEQIATLDVSHTLSEIKYIGKRLDSIDKTISEMKEKGLKKEVELSFTCDGYELVKKPVGCDREDPIIDPLYSLKVIFEPLSDIECKVLTHRFGLYNATKKTYAEIAKNNDFNVQTASRIEKRALKKLRHPDRIELCRTIRNKELRVAICGE